jgi:hypothetical protein
MRVDSAAHFAAWEAAYYLFVEGMVIFYLAIGHNGLYSVKGWHYSPLPQVCWQTQIMSRVVAIIGSTIISRGHRRVRTPQTMLVRADEITMEKNISSAFIVFLHEITWFYVVLWGKCQFWGWHLTPTLTITWVIKSRPTLVVYAN